MRAATLAAVAVVALVVVGTTMAGGHLHKEFLLQRAYDSLGRAAWVRSIRAVGGRGPGIHPLLIRGLPELPTLRLNLPTVRLAPVGAPTGQPPRRLLNVSGRNSQPAFVPATPVPWMPRPGRAVPLATARLARAV